MKAEKLKRTFLKAKLAAGLDFAVVYPDEFGDCNTCVWDALVTAFGRDCRGIWAKEWRRGINASKSLAKKTRVYIAHDLTDEQAAIVFDVFTKNGYKITSGDFDAKKCIIIEEEYYGKNTNF